MDSKTIRYQNVRYLVEYAGGVSSFAEKIGKGQSQTSQFAGSTPIKGIGNKIAREIEFAFNKEYGWLDIAHPELWQTTKDLKDSSLHAYSQDKNKYSRSKSLENLISTLEKLEATRSLSPETIDYLLRSAQAFSAEQKLKNLKDSSTTIDYPMLVEGHEDDVTGGGG